MDFNLSGFFREIFFYLSTFELRLWSLLVYVEGSKDIFYILLLLTNFNGYLTPHCLRPFNQHL